MPITCFEPDINQSDVEAVTNTVKSKILGFGPNVEAFEKEYAKFSRKKYNIGFNSASSAIYCLFQYLYETVGPCNVYTTAIGFVSPVFAAIKNGHQVRFVDVGKDLLLSPEDALVKFQDNGRPNVVMPVLYGGVSTISGFEEKMKGKKFILVLDSAHCISPTLNYDYAFYSFHPVKPICMSNGGLLATDHQPSSEYLTSGRNFGREVKGDTYDLVQSGFNFYMNNLNASLGLSQINRCLSNVQKRKQNFEFLRDNIPSCLGAFTDHDKFSSYYLSTFILKDDNTSAILRKYLTRNGIQSSFHYPFLHKTKYYKTDIQLPYTDSLEDKIINLPIHQNLEQQDLEKIVNECIRYSRSGS
tara:strand:- start:287 stop:1357 length:1071 start_codon:yes stop_codon:yes gene_type:complete